MYYSQEDKSGLCVCILTPINLAIDVRRSHEFIPHSDASSHELVRVTVEIGR